MMTKKLRFASSVFLGLVGLSGTTWAQTVRVVDAAGGGQFRLIQAAVDQSADGDVVLIRTGTYAEEVSLVAKGLTLVGEGDPLIEGRIVVRDSGADQTLLLSGLQVQMPSPGPPFIAELLGAVDVRDCQGSVRVQDCDLRGADAAIFVGPQLPDGSAAFYAQDSRDIALIDTLSSGGMGSFSVVAASGNGGEGVFAQDVNRIALIRSVLRGGRGGNGDDGGDGGHGGSIQGDTELLVAASFLFGGDGGNSNQYGTPGWENDGGLGLSAGLNSFTYDFAGNFAGGQAGGCNYYCTPGGSPGAAISNPALVLPLAGFPSAVQVPSIVREGSPWQWTVFGQSGDLARPFFAGETTLRFRPALKQPNLLTSPAFATIQDAVIGGQGSASLDFPAPVIPLGADARVLWTHARVGAPGALKTISSTRAIVMLRSGF